MAIEDDLDAQALWRSVCAMLLARRGEVEDAITLSLEAIDMRGAATPSSSSPMP